MVLFEQNMIKNVFSQCFRHAKHVIEELLERQGDGDRYEHRNEGGELVNASYSPTCLCRGCILASRGTGSTPGHPRSIFPAVTDLFRFWFASDVVLFIAVRKVLLEPDQAVNQKECQKHYDKIHQEKDCKVSDSFWLTHEASNHGIYLYLPLRKKKPIFF